MKVALYQMNIVWENKKENFIKTKYAVINSVKNNADVLFLPEMTFTGFSTNTNNTAESDYLTVNFVKELCVKHKIAIGFGWTKKSGNLCENCYTVIDKNGNELSTYVKIHPFTYADEDKYFVKGKSLTFYEIDNFGFSTAICYDTRFPELFSAISENKKVKAIVIPANWPAKRCEHWRTLIRARAIENQVYIIAVNCVGKINEIYYSGNSCIINPNGETVVEENDCEKILFAELDFNIENYRKNFPVYKDRQIELYKELL